MTEILRIPRLSGSLSIVGNADFAEAVRFVVDGAPVDLSGIDFRMQARAADDASLVALDLSTGDGGLISGGAAGTLTIWSPKETNQAIPAGAYVADVLAMADGLTRNLCPTGPLTVTVLAGVTR